jgi:hypothetical protein
MVGTTARRLDPIRRGPGVMSCSSRALDHVAALPTSVNTSKTSPTGLRIVTDSETTLTGPTVPARST